MDKSQRKGRIYFALLLPSDFASYKRLHALIKKILMSLKSIGALCLPLQLWISHIMMHYETSVWCRKMRALPSPGMILSETVLPASLIRLTMSECDLFVMEQPLTARIRSPTFSFPQRSAGLPSMMRPILWGIATQAFPAFYVRCVCVYVFFFFMLKTMCGIDLFDWDDYLCWFAFNVSGKQGENIIEERKRRAD